MKTLKLRVVAKSGEYLGDVDTISIWKGEVLFNKYDKWGCAINPRPMIARYPQEVNIEMSLDGKRWDKVQVPSVDDSAVLHMAGVTQ